MRTKVLSLFIIAVVGCACDQKPQSQAMNRADDSSVSAQSPERVRAACNAACERLDFLGCPEAHGAVGGDGCVSLCIKASGTPFAYQAKCITDATDQVALHACNVRCAVVKK